METKPIEDLLAEGEEALKTVVKATEGLRHMLDQRDLRDVTEQSVNELLKRYEHRHTLHEALDERASETKLAIEALLADGYPEEPTRLVDHEVTEDLDQNSDTIEYARSRFKVRQLTTKGSFEAGEQHAP